MKTAKLIILILLGAALMSCDKHDQAPSRSFYMGFTPFPYALSVEAADYTYATINKDADIVNHHFDNGVPWVEALKDAPFSSNIMNDWTYRKNATAAGKKIYLSLGPLSPERTKLANYRGESDDMPLPAPWDGYRFNDDQVKQAYLNYCKRAIDFFHPDFFNMAIEANLLYYLNPGLWTDFLDFHRYIYQQLKLSYPSLTIFSSVTGAHMLSGFFDNNDYVQQRLAVLQILENSDLYALSFYPYLSKYAGNTIPENTFEQLFTISDKPLAIAETGYPAQSFSIDTGSGLAAISGDAVNQNSYMKNLLNACQKHHAKFVINFVARDYDQLWQSIGGKSDITIAWRDTGLYDENGNMRPSYSTWKQYLARTVSITN